VNDCVAGSNRFMPAPEVPIQTRPALSRHQAKEGGKLPTTFKYLGIAYRGHRCRSGEKTNTRNIHQLFAGNVFFLPKCQLIFYPDNIFVKRFNPFKLLPDCVDKYLCSAPGSLDTS
jgi:hypothetical protein